MLRQRQRASQLDQSPDELPEERGRLFGGRSIRSFDGGAAARKLLGRQVVPPATRSISWSLRVRISLFVGIAVLPKV